MYQRHNPINTLLGERAFGWQEVHQMSVATALGSEIEEEDRWETAALCDVSALPKVSMKGPGVEEWVQSAGLPVLESVYDWELFSEGGLVIKIDRDQYFIEEGLSSNHVGVISEKLRSFTGNVYRVERQDTGLFLYGSKVRSVLAQTCGYDFSKPGSEFILSRLAVVPCMILKIDRLPDPFFRIWCSPSYGVYLWQNLVRIVEDLGGGPVGFSRFQSEVSR